MTIKEFNCSSSRRDYLVKFNNSINDLRLNTVLLESVYSTTIDNFERQRETEREIIRPEQRRKAISIDATVRKITKYLEKGWSQVNNSLVFGGHVLRIIFIWEPKEPLLCGVLCACFAFFVRSSVRIPTTLTIVYAPRVCTFFPLKFVYILFFVWTRVIAVH